MLLESFSLVNQDRSCFSTWFLIAFAALSVSTILSSRSASAEPLVITTIKPIHSLTAAVMEGVGTPSLLVHGVASPHNFTLRPSQVKQVSEAELVIWVGRSVDGFMQSYLKTQPENTHMTLVEAAGIKLLLARQDPDWEAHNQEDTDDNGDSHDQDRHEEDKGEMLHVNGERLDAIDAHIWLDPKNAMAITRAIATRLIALDPANAELYLANRDRTLQRLESLDKELIALTRVLENQKFLVFHDAYQYLEKAYRLAGVGSVTIHPERPLSAKRLSEIQTQISNKNIKALFLEPQFSGEVVAQLTAGTGICIGKLDPLGSAIPEGSDHYFEMMTRLAYDLRYCLEPN